MSFLIRRSPDILLICSSPRLIAACHVLLRLLMPRHSPYALCSLNFLVLLNFALLENRNIVLFGCLLLKRLVYHPSAKLYFFYHFCLERPNIIFIASFYLFVFYSLFKDQSQTFFKICLVGLDGEPCSNVPRLIRRRISLIHFQTSRTLRVPGRSGWTRTIDLALIRRAL